MTDSPPSKIKPSLIFLAIAILIGGYIRLSQVLRAPLPLNDGGMFYTMTRDLMENGYRLPETASYNGLDIPYAYPPLAFYLAGGLADLTGWDLLDLFRILPAVFTVLAIPAFYLLARELCQDELQLILATLMFALMPASFDWLIMGGGMTRSPAFLLTLLTLQAIYRLYMRKEARYIFWTALLAALSILTHPETALHTIASAIVFFLFFGKNRAGLLKSLAVAGLTILLTAPWWRLVLARHGWGPFLSASQSGWYTAGAAFQLLRFDLTHEYDLQTIGVLGLIGFFWSLAEKKRFAPFWLLALFVSEPRSASLYTTPVVAILASHTLGRTLQLFDRLRHPAQETLQPFSSGIARLAFALLLGQWTYSALGTTLLLSRTVALTPADRQAFAWVAANTPSDSRFLILTGYPPLSDPVAEWFPALSGRRSLATLQGQEWNENGNFTEFMEASIALQTCFHRTPDCLADWLVENKASADYLLIRTPVMPEQNPLIHMLETGENYTLVYQTETVTILRAK
jgi:hypothetical protein